MPSPRSARTKVTSRHVTPLFKREYPDCYRNVRNDPGRYRRVKSEGGRSSAAPRPAQQHSAQHGRRTALSYSGCDPQQHQNTEFRALSAGPGRARTRQPPSASAPPAGAARPPSLPPSRSAPRARSPLSPGEAPHGRRTARPPRAVPPQEPERGREGSAAAKPSPGRCPPAPRPASPPPRTAGRSRAAPPGLSSPRVRLLRHGCGGRPGPALLLRRLLPRRAAPGLSGGPAAARGPTWRRLRGGRGAKGGSAPGRGGDGGAGDGGGGGARRCFSSRDAGPRSGAGWASWPARRRRRRRRGAGRGRAAAAGPGQAAPRTRARARARRRRSPRGGGRGEASRAHNTLTCRRRAHAREESSRPRGAVVGPGRTAAMRAGR